MLNWQKSLGPCRVLFILETQNVVRGQTKYPWGCHVSKTRINSRADFKVEGSFEMETSCATLENLSIIVSMTVLPSDRGNPMMKLITIYDRGRLGVGNG